MTEPVDIIVISLRESTQRRAQAAAQLDAAGLAWHFQDAVKGADLSPFPVEYDRIKRLQFNGCDLNPGEIGCFLSHRQAWEACVQSQRLTLILEDDFQFKQEPAAVLASVLENLPYFDVLRLQGISRSCRYKTLKDYGKYRLVRHPRDPLGTTAYVLKPAAAKRLLKKSGRFYEAVDGFLGGYWVHRLKVLSLFPHPVFSDNSPSTICREKKPVDRIKLLMNLRKLPRSVAKRLYRLEASVSQLFVRIK